MPSKGNPRITIRFTPDQIDRISGSAENAGLSVSEWVRMVVLAYLKTESEKPA